MADNYLEKRYRDVFGSGSSVDPETGWTSATPKVKALRKSPSATGHRTDNKKGPTLSERPLSKK